MILLIPLGGIGERFKNFGYKEPKGLINVEGKPIIYWLLDNINTTNIDYIYIIYNKEYAEYNLEELLINKYINIKFKFFKLNINTNGALETISIALNEIINEDDKPIICIDGDNFYLTDIIKHWNGENTIITFNDNKIYDIPKYSYILTEVTEVIEDVEYILDIQEKKKYDSDKSIACTGAYGFDSFKELYKYSNKVLSDINYKVKGEYYVSSVIKYMIQNNIFFKNKTIENKYYFSLGTPEQVKEFEYIFLLDLDGTLVDTDELYLDVWKELLKDDNIFVDIVYYNKIIKGKSDKNFLQSIIPNISDNKILEISKRKDELFVNKIEKIKLYDNVINFLEQLINCRTTIVTNCNRKAVSKILEYFNIDKYINNIICADECILTKPDKEPYINGMSFFNKKDITKCIVFEDSYTGYLSAKNANINNIFIKINGIKSEMSLLNTKNFKNYDEINVSILIDEIENLNIIRNSFNIPICDIKEATIKTGGYICDIIKYKIIFNNNNNLNIILKISNNDNSLSFTAKKLELYKNEKYFYEYISYFIKDFINIPFCYNVCDNNRKICIILEDLNDMNGVFNINLNKNKNILMNVISEISKLHIKNYFKNYDEIPAWMNKTKTMKDYDYYSILVNKRFDLFIKNNEDYFSKSMKQLFYKIKNDYNCMLNASSTYPLSLCHGDLKSPNIFYKDSEIPYFLDFQYINLNKGVSDIIFLLIESVDFDKELYEDVLIYYYNNLIKNNIEYDYNIYRYFDVRNALCLFPFFVMVWFNTENKDNLVDKNFPMRFMNKLIKYYEYEFERLL